MEKVTTSGPVGDFVVTLGGLSARWSYASSVTISNTIGDPNERERIRRGIVWKSSNATPQVRRGVG